ncbi:Tryptophan synthase alpha chain [Labilithrix luteola]|uniref:Tryptophan synthase alpha chain n=1 Tax=Labilithrix luteola TaxID=1391654 RepID=A0A0K1Q4B1_9BACT|nr:carboxypeptidase-like regulatory domain-containing protein [Labilithrix luteola]AKV00205.1 Tryptophan synthase alpha chain [Labilithrix luteola]
MRHGFIDGAPFALVATALIVACSTNPPREAFVPEAENEAGVVDSDAGSGSGGSLGDPTPCTELACKVADCDDGPTTTLKGKVYDPSGANPLSNVQVYIPSDLKPGEALPALSDSTVNGVVCETCASVIVHPLASAVTNEKGEFTLENVPIDTDVPVVIQVGKWRRRFEIEVKNACAENEIPDGTLKLPRNGAEGDMPQIAVTTGGCDALECMLRGVGIDEKEFVDGHGGSGHVHVFKGDAGRMGAPAEPFWSDAEQLKKYDMVLLSCECDEHLENKRDRQPVYDYLNAGGRVFATHFHYTWFKYSPAYEFREIAVWGDPKTPSGDYDINMSFPRGDMLARWLVEVGGSSTLGKVPLTQVTNSITRVRSPATTWISNPDAPKFFSFNTPMYAKEDQQCGRAVFSDVHITGAAGPANIWSCPMGPGGLTGQQKALEFLFFDLSSCVQPIEQPPEPPK